MTTATLTDADTITLAFPLAAAEGLRHAITLALPQRPTSERDMLASIYGALVNPQPAPTARAACAPVDVLATYDRLIREVPMGAGHMRNITEARAAIAELIADGWNMVATARHTGEPIDPERLASALARVGGGK